MEYPGFSPEYKFDGTEVLQLLDSRNEWVDYCSIKNASERRYAEVKVDGSRAGSFRIVRYHAGITAIYS